MTYLEHIRQNHSFPQDEFSVGTDGLRWCDIPLREVVNRYRTPLKFTYLPRISENIRRAKDWFATAMKKHNYNGKYRYCYCTKSAHFSYILGETLQNDIDLETSSAADLDIMEHLLKEDTIDRDQHIICNGYKTDHYLDQFFRLRKLGARNTMTVLDNEGELDRLERRLEAPAPIGLRIATRDGQLQSTSRHGIPAREIPLFCEKRISSNPKFVLKLLHFYVSSGINDEEYYWKEVEQCLRLYTALRPSFPELNALNIGGGFPVKNSLDFGYDYAGMVDKIIGYIAEFCREKEVPQPDIYTEFGSYTVGNSSGAIFQILQQKQQSDNDRWNIIDNSFMNNFPDNWALNKDFIVLPINRWGKSPERVRLGGLTCDSEDYFRTGRSTDALFLPKFEEAHPLYVGIFHTGAYQDSLGGYDGYRHCLIPNPKQLIIDRKSNGTLKYHLAKPEQSPGDMLRSLGYR